MIVRLDNLPWLVVLAVLGAAIAIYLELSE